MLALYHAELARAVHLRCDDIGELTSAKSFLSENSTAWEQALLFLNSMIYYIIF